MGDSVLTTTHTNIKKEKTMYEKMFRWYMKGMITEQDWKIYLDERFWNVLWSARDVMIRLKYR